MRPVDGERTLPRAYTIGAAAALLLVVTVALSIFLGVQTRTQFEEIETSWRAYAGGTDRKGAWISALHGHLVDAGIVHHFKNYVLRHDAVYLREARAQLAQFDTVMAAYLAAPLDARERRALESIRATVDDDRARLPIATGPRVRAGRPSGPTRWSRSTTPTRFAPSPISRGSGRPRARSARGRSGGRSPKARRSSRSAFSRSGP